MHSIMLGYIQTFEVFLLKFRDFIESQESHEKNLEGLTPVF